MGETMTEEEKEELKELKRCFKYICDKLDWRIDLERQTRCARHCICSENAAPKRKSNLSYYQIRMYRNMPCQFSDKNVDVLVPIHAVVNAIDVPNMSRTTGEFAKVIQTAGACPTATTLHHACSAQLDCLRTMKRYFTGGVFWFVTDIFRSSYNDRPAVELLDPGIPKFNTLEDLRIKMDLECVKMRRIQLKGTWHHIPHYHD